MGQRGNKLGELLVQESLIDTKQRQLAKAEQKKQGGRLVDHLSSLGYVDEKEIAELFGKQYQIATTSLETFEIDPKVSALVSKEICIKHRIIPVSKVGGTVVFASSDIHIEPYESRFRIRYRIDGN